MRTCPVCLISLLSEEYEGVRIARCPKCRGVLLPGYKFDMIRHFRQRSSADLKQEAEADFSGNTTATLRCPKCRTKMEKHALARRLSLVTVDYCSTCDRVWLDAGELALAQLVFEASARGRELLDHQQRMLALEASPARKARFEEALARMPDTEDVSYSALDGDETWPADLLDLLAQIARRTLH
jgi:Zn-finger nucleic acid-binding protein